MVTENQVQRGVPWPERPGLTEERSCGANMRPGATITSAAFSISVKPMRCKCINFAGLMEFYIRDVATRELSDIKLNARPKILGKRSERNQRRSIHQSDHADTSTANTASQL